MNLHLNTRRYFRLALAMLLLASTAACTHMGITPLPQDELVKLYQTPDSRVMVINGLRLHYRDEGNPNGPVLLMMHGVFSSLQTWDGWTNALKKDYRIIRVDVPGFGMSDALPGDDYDGQQALLIIKQLIDRLGIKRITTVGNSYGGWLAWQLGAQYPDQVERIAVVDGLSFPLDWGLEIILLSNPPTSWLAPSITPREFIAYGVWRVYGDGSNIKDGVIDRYHRLLLNGENRSQMIKVVQWLRRIYVNKETTPIPAGVTTLKQPLITMWGGKDVWLPYDSVGKPWKQYYPNQTHKFYPELGHVGMEEDAERTVADFKAFMCKTNPQLGYSVTSCSN